MHFLAGIAEVIENVCKMLILHVAILNISVWL